MSAVLGTSALAADLSGWAVSDYQQAKEAGLTVLNDPPVPGAHNTQVTFLHPKCTFGVLTEFCQHPGGCGCGK